MPAPKIVHREPVISAQLIALVGLVLAEALDWIEVGMGEWGAIVGAVLAAAGVSRQRVTPVEH